MDANGQYKVFSGANGLYIAFEGDDGFHRAPSQYSRQANQGWGCEERLEAECRRLNADAPDYNEEIGSVYGD